VVHRGGGFGINTSGQIGGYIYDASGTEHAGVFTNGVFQQAASVTGCNYSEGHGINDSGVLIATGLCSNGHQHAYTTHSGVLADLGGPYNGDSNANGINDAGQVVGVGKHNGVEHGYLFTPAQLQVICCG